MPRSLSSCIGSTITIDLQEKCMAEKNKEYEYGLTSDHLYYKIIRTIVKTEVASGVYQYKGSFTKDEITKFICNENMNF